MTTTTTTSMTSWITWNRAFFLFFLALLLFYLHAVQYYEIHDERLLYQLDSWENLHPMCRLRRPFTFPAIDIHPPEWHTSFHSLQLCLSNTSLPVAQEPYDTTMLLFSTATMKTPLYWSQNNSNFLKHHSLLNPWIRQVDSILATSSSCMIQKKKHDIWWGMPDTWSNVRTAGGGYTFLYIAESEVRIQWRQPDDDIEISQTEEMLFTFPVGTLVFIPPHWHYRVGWGHQELGAYVVLFEYETVLGEILHHVEDFTSFAFKKYQNTL